MRQSTLQQIAISFTLFQITVSGFAQGTIPVANQGQINFNTFNSNPAKGNVYNEDTSHPVNSAWDGQLWYSLTQNGTMQPLSAVVQFGANGYIAQGVINDANDEASTVIWYELVVWNAAAGSTYFQATGLTNPGNGATGGGPGLNPSPQLINFGTTAETKATLGGQDQEGDVPSAPPTANGFNNMVMFIPEPSTVALLGVGAAGAFALRRRK